MNTIDKVQKLRNTINNFPIIYHQLQHIDATPYSLFFSIFSVPMSLSLDSVMLNLP